MIQISVEMRVWEAIYFRQTQTNTLEFRSTFNKTLLHLFRHEEHNTRADKMLLLDT